MSKPNTTQKQASTISNNNTKVKYSTVNKLTPEQRELVADLGYFVQKWSVPRIAKTLGVRKQSVQFQIDKKNK